jgi:hypothetical protein
MNTSSTDNRTNFEVLTFAAAISCLITAVWFFSSTVLS